MRRARLTSIRKIEIDRKCPEPVITSPEQVLLKIRYSAVNSDDFNVFSGALPTPYDDRTLLHETAGEIVDLGEDAKRLGFAVGDHVTTNVSFGCGVCPMCRQGKVNLCLDKHGVGASSDLLLLDGTSLVHLPKDISLKEGALYWLATCCIRGVERAGIQPNQSVLIIGGGSTGQMLLQIIKKRMPRVVVVSELIESKRELALRLGADEVIDPNVENLEERALDLTGGLGFDVVIDAAGALNALENVTSLIARGGTLMLYSYYKVSDYLRLNLMETYWKELTVVSSYGADLAHYTGSDVRTLEYLDLRSLIGEIVPFEKMQDAFEQYGTHEKLRILIEY